MKTTVHSQLHCLIYIQSFTRYQHDARDLHCREGVQTKAGDFEFEEKKLIRRYNADVSLHASGDPFC
jgi:hypothetical protein